MAHALHCLTIVIPALNEESAIGDTVRRCLEARDHIIASSRVEDVEIIVVSDGSTDRTEEIARTFDDVTVLVFAKNRGYGAAIKCGFAHGSGDLLGFLDADGTCDPRFFANLCDAIDAKNADLALGSRMGTESKMPLIRSAGNTIFSVLLGVLSKRVVKDTASGMRVIRRSCLSDLYPLPDGLHFTPAMSARVLLEEKLRLVELPMPYHERTGRSKLNVARDGVRFLTAIVHAAVAYRPSRPLLVPAAIFALGSLAVGIYPVVFLLRNGWLEEWMIYRVLLASLLSTLSAILVCTAVVADRIASIAHGRLVSSSGLTGAISRLFTRRKRRIGGIILVGLAAAIVWPGIVEYVSTGHVEMHWSRPALASLLLVLAGMLGVTTFLLHMMELIQARNEDAGGVWSPDRIHHRHRGASGSA